MFAFQPTPSYDKEIKKEIKGKIKKESDNNDIRINYNNTEEEKKVVEVVRNENSIKTEGMTENEKRTVSLFIEYFGKPPLISDYAIMEKLYCEYSIIEIKEAFEIGREHKRDQLTLAYIKGILKNKGNGNGKPNFDKIIS